MDTGKKLRKRQNSARGSEILHIGGIDYVVTRSSESLQNDCAVSCGAINETSAMGTYVKKCFDQSAVAAATHNS